MYMEAAMDRSVTRKKWPGKVSAQRQDRLFVGWVEEEERCGACGEEDCSGGDSKGEGRAEQNEAFDDCKQGDDEIAGGEADGRHGAEEPEEEKSFGQVDEGGDGEQRGEIGQAPGLWAEDSAAEEQKGGVGKKEEGDGMEKGDVLQQVVEPDSGDAGEDDGG
jgi:hypothetical protein